jgi:large subunit ribosomal protein L24e
MVERRVCSFCGTDIEPGTGRMYIKKDGTTFNFCSNKCRKNLVFLERTPRWTKWTENYVKEKGEAAPKEKPTKKLKKAKEEQDEESGEKKEEKEASKKKDETGEEKPKKIKKE